MFSCKFDIQTKYSVKYSKLKFISDCMRSLQYALNIDRANIAMPLNFYHLIEIERNINITALKDSRASSHMFDNMSDPCS